MLNSGQTALLFRRNLLFSGATDDSVIFVLLCLCVSVGRNIALESECYCYLSNTKHSNRVWDLRYRYFFLFAHLLVDCVIFTEPAKADTELFSTTWLIALKGKIHS
ncbi:hypothetical protein AMECASPLE_020509 [Ameca splendens]|uniref:Secreted protein n=1 Tax=Ameca splendens TaxID=208324 RepID=A0ABV0ZDD7_9TELE